MLKRVAPLFHVAALLLLAGCGQTPSAAQSREPVTGEATAAAPTATPVVELVAEEPAMAENPNPCLECHSDQQRLIETAKVEQEAPDESSGVG